MTVRQLAVMLLLRDKGEMQFRDIARSVGISKASCSRSLSALAVFGLARSFRGERDARDVLSGLTEKGKEMLKLSGVVMIMVLMAMPVMAQQTQSDTSWQPLGGTPMTTTPAPAPYPTAPLGGVDIR